MGAAICFAAWKIYDKRLKRAGEDAPSPLWGALGSTLLALVIGGVVSPLRWVQNRRYIFQMFVVL
jgi:hypothetical protein